jgi:hypothetical protein
MDKILESRYFVFEVKALVTFLLYALQTPTHLIPKILAAYLPLTISSSLISITHTPFSRNEELHYFSGDSSSS